MWYAIAAGLQYCYSEDGGNLILLWWDLLLYRAGNRTLRISLLIKLDVLDQIHQYLSVLEKIPEHEKHLFTTKILKKRPVKMNYLNKADTIGSVLNSDLN